MADQFEELKAQLKDTPNRSVADDMLSMMEAKLPKGAFGPPPPQSPASSLGGNPFLLNERIKQMEEETRKLKEKVDELTTAKPSLPEDTSMLVGTQETMQAACDALHKIVDTFNESLEDWYKRSGCVVNFVWKYEPCKLLEIAGVDVIVYRRPAPSAITIKEALDNAPTEV
jgi:hypothetical protein